MVEPPLPLTLTRVIVPRRRNDLLTRPRLLEALNQLLDNKLVIIVAQAGYGKTSLLVDFAHNTEWPFAWFSLDRPDQDPLRFIAHLIYSISLQFPRFGERSMSVLRTMAQGEINLDSLVSVVVNDAYEHITEHYVVVLDDYHLVDESQPVGFFLSQFIQNSDENCHVILISRSLVSLPDLPLLVARGLVGGLNHEDLAFTAGEIQQMFSQNYQRLLSDAAAKDMARYSEGWVTGLLISARASNHQLIDWWGAGKPSGVALTDYIRQQIVDQQPEPLRLFMLRTSLLDEFDVDTCRNILGQALGITEDWGGLIDKIVHENLFILPLGEDGIWLRYHHLILDYLRAEMRHQRPDETRLIQERLVEVSIQKGEWERAFSLLKQVNDTTALVSFIERFGTKLIEQGRLTNLQQWLDAIPGEIACRNPRILSLQGSAAMMQGDPQLGLHQLNQAINLMDQKNDRALLADALIRRSTIHRSLGKYQEALADAEMAEGLCDGSILLEANKADSLRVKGLVYNALGEITTALAFLEQALTTYLEVRDENAASIVRMEIGMVQAASGNYLLAEHAYTKALDYWQRTNNYTWLANVLNNLGDLQRQTADYEGALASLERAVEYAQMSGYLRLQAFALASIGDLYSDLDAIDQAIEACRQARSIAKRIQSRFLEIYLNLLEAVLSNRRGSTLIAQSLITNASAIISSGGSKFEEYSCALEAGRIQAANHEWHTAIKTLEPCYDFFKQSRQQQAYIRARLYLAFSRCQVTQSAAADEELLNSLVEAFALENRILLFLILRELRPYTTVFLSRARLGEVMAELLTEADNYERNLQPLRRLVRRKALSVPFAPPRLSIQALGKSQVRLDDHVVSPGEWNSQSARDLFFLLLARPEGVAKEQAGSYFWPESTPSELKMRFKNAIYKLRYALGKDVVIHQDDIYRFNTQCDYEFDVEAFYREIYHAEKASDKREKISHYQVANKLYQGPYLPECKDVWVLAERQKIHNVMLESALTVTRLLLDAGDRESALMIIQRTLNEDPCHEEAHRLAMRVFFALGNQGAVARQFNTCRQILRDELGVNPSVETIELFEKLAKIKNS